MSIGGWSGSIHFSNLVGSDENRKRFAKEIKAFMDKYEFDGVDLGEYFLPSKLNVPRRLFSKLTLAFVSEKIGNTPTLPVSVATRSATRILPTSSSSFKSFAPKSGRSASSLRQSRLPPLTVPTVLPSLTFQNSPSTWTTST